MKLDYAESNSKSWSLRLAAALMIAAGYYGELVVTGDLSQRGSFAMSRVLSEGRRSISLTPAPPLQVFSSSLIPDDTKHTIEASLAEDPAEGLALSAPEANASELQSGGVVETPEELLLRCRAHLRFPPQPRGDVTIGACAGSRDRDEQNGQTSEVERRSLRSAASGLGQGLCRRSFTSGGDP